MYLPDSSAPKSGSNIEDISAAAARDDHKAKKSLGLELCMRDTKQHHKFYDVTQLAHDQKGYNKYAKEPSI